MAGRTRNVALIGFMGVGKTSVGRVFAHLADMYFVDADAEIEKIAEMPISRIFDLHGEGHFRCLEYEFYHGMSFARDVVIATGGGAVLDTGIRTILRENALVVYLAASPKAIAARIGNDNSRPLLSGGNRLVKIAKMLDERDMLYRQTCHAVIDTEDISVEACAKNIWDLTKKSG